MKTVLKITLIFFLGVINLQAQTKSPVENISPDPDKFNYFIEQVFNKPSSQLKQEKANFWKLLSDLYNNRITYIKPQEEPSNYSFISSAPIYNNKLKVSEKFNPKEFNPLNYKLNIHNSKSIEYYRIYDTGYYMVIKPYNQSVFK